MLNTNINIHTTHPVIVTQFISHSQAQSKSSFKSLNISYDTVLKIPEDLAVRFYSQFQKSKTAKYNQKKVKKILLEAISFFKSGENLSNRINSKCKHINIRRMNDQKVFFKLSSQASEWFNEIANSNEHQNNRQRKSILFSLLEEAFLQYVRRNEKAIN